MNVTAINKYNIYDKNLFFINIIINCIAIIVSVHCHTTISDFAFALMYLGGNSKRNANPYIP